MKNQRNYLILTVLILPTLILLGSFYQSAIPQHSAGQTVAVSDNIELHWNLPYGGIYDETVTAALLTANDDVILVGSTLSFGAGGVDIWVIQVDATGAPQWNQIYGGSDNEFGSFVLPTSDAGLLLVGGTAVNGQGDILLVKLGRQAMPSRQRTPLAFHCCYYLWELSPSYSESVE
ncbi:MAG: hypothetical protein ACFFGZ_02480 [Candidatus Thorarchaeota archaeon]